MQENAIFLIFASVTTRRYHDGRQRDEKTSHFAFCVLSLEGCSPKTKPTETTTFEIADAASLTVRSGITGESIDMTDAEDISYITDNISALTFSKGDKVDSDGWSYFLCWKDENGNEIEEMALTGDGCTVIYDGHYYKSMTVDGEIDLLFLERQFAE